MLKTKCLPMNKFKSHEKFETVATLMWLLMDFFWMNKFEYAATILGSVAVWMAIFAMITYSGTSRSVFILLVSAICWIMMNFCWVISDLYSISWVMVAANIFFVICLILTIFAFVRARQEKRPLDFKRMKID